MFTTRPDTLCGAAYLVVAPEHPLLDRLTAPEQREAVQAYVRSAASKSDLERSELQKSKTGVATGAHSSLLHERLALATHRGSVSMPCTGCDIRGPCSALP